LILLVAVSVVDYIRPVGIDTISENNPIAFVQDNIWNPIASSMETPSNVIPLDNYNLDFEAGTIGWHLHYLYSVPPDYWETTFEQSKSGRQSLRLAHTCDTTETTNVRVYQTKQCLFRTDKLPEFEQNVYVKFYVKSLRKHENSWWPDPLYEFATQTQYSLNVEAIDEWGERIYTKDIITDIYNYQNSQLTKIVEYDMVDEGNATEYFKKINGYDYNATKNGSLEDIQKMIDLQNSQTSGKVYYYVTNIDSLPTSSYAVYLGDGWYTVIMPVPKETRYLGFNSQVNCSGQNEYWSYGPMMTVYYPDAPASADTLTYLDGIVFINSITDSDIAVTNTTSTTTGTSSNTNWTNDVSDNTSSNTTTKSTATKIWGFLIFIGIIILIILLSSPRARKGVIMFGKKQNILPKGNTMIRTPRVPKVMPPAPEKRVAVRSYYRNPKGEGSGKGFL
jgi:hypothetical protein